MNCNILYPQILGPSHTYSRLWIYFCVCFYSTGALNISNLVKSFCIFYLLWMLIHCWNFIILAGRMFRVVSFLEYLCNYFWFCIYAYKLAYMSFMQICVFFCSIFWWCISCILVKCKWHPGESFKKQQLCSLSRENTVLKMWLPRQAPSISGVKGLWPSRCCQDCDSHWAQPACSVVRYDGSWHPEISGGPQSILTLFKSDLHNVWPLQAGKNPLSIFSSLPTTDNHHQLASVEQFGWLEHGADNTNVTGSIPGWDNCIFQLCRGLD